MGAISKLSIGVGSPNPYRTIALQSNGIVPAAAMRITPAIPGTCTGIFESVVVPIPSCPSQLYPQVHTVPSFFKATECKSPAAMAIMLSRPVARTGESEPLVVPLPRVVPQH